jgi:hypothetical protein
LFDDKQKLQLNRVFFFQGVEHKPCCCKTATQLPYNLSLKQHRISNNCLGNALTKDCVMAQWADKTKP